MADYLDTFTAADGTRLDGLSASTGQTYDGGGSEYKIESNRLRGGPFAEPMTVFESDGTTAYQTPAEYDLEVDFHVVSNQDTSSMRFGGSDGGTDAYWIIMQSRGTPYLDLTKFIGGIETNLHQEASAIAVGSTGSIKIEVRSDDLKVYLDTVLIYTYTILADDPDIQGQLSYYISGGASRGFHIDSASITGVASGPDYTARKGATGVEITHTLTADGITSATLNGEGVTLASQAGQVATLNLDESAITTSGEYDLVLGDGVGTQTFTVQYNVIGISSKNLNKDGLDLASLDNLEIIVATLGGLQLARYTNKLTTPQGDTGTVLVNTGSALDMVNVSFISGDLNYTQKTELEVI